MGIHVAQSHNIIQEEAGVAAHVAKAMYNKGTLYDKQNKQEEKVAAFIQCIERYKNRKEVQIAQFVVLALHFVGFHYELQKKTKEAIENYKAIIELYDRVDNPQSNSLLKSFVAISAMNYIQLADKNGIPVQQSLLSRYSEFTKGNQQANLTSHLQYVLREIDEKKKEEFFEAIDTEKQRTDKFIKDETCFKKNMSFLLHLREWNSYTPVISTQEEQDRGGGYYLQHRGEGLVIDPGYDFINIFQEAGGHLCDINHIIITHAHDDHTADFEALRMLIFRAKKERPTITVCLYLSVSAERKFSGLLRLDDNLFTRIVILNHPCKDEYQTIYLADTISLVTLPAYHYDVISYNHAIGFLLKLKFDDKTSKNIIFTGDSGYFPVKWDKDKPKEYKYIIDGEEVTETELDTEPEKALAKRYKDIIKDTPIDLLVAHIGTIQKYEFDPKHERALMPDNSYNPYRNMYVNHLGMLGMLMLINEIRPALIIISEFGSELKNIRIELVGKLKDALDNMMKKEKRKNFLIPGDITVIYNIADGTLLKHSKKSATFIHPKNIIVESAANYVKEFVHSTGKYDPKDKSNFKRTCLISSYEADSYKDESERNDAMKEYFKRYFNYDKDIPTHLPIHIQTKKNDG